MQKVVFQDLLTKGQQLSVCMHDVMIHGLYIRGLFGEALIFKSRNERQRPWLHPIAATFDIIIHALLEKIGNDNSEKLLHEVIERGLMQK